MPYDNEYLLSGDSDNEFNNFNDSIQEELQSSESLADGIEDNDSNSNIDSSSSNNTVDYSTYLEDIVINQNQIIANQEIIIDTNKQISDNAFRLYYFVGGLYIAFAILIGIKFFKIFLF